MSNLIQTAPAVFQFQSQEIRVISSDINHPEFVAIDVAKAGGLLLSKIKHYNQRVN